MHLCTYFPPYGLVPSELSDTFPFSHTEAPKEPDRETLEAMSELVRAYLTRNRNYGTLVLVHSGEGWQMRFSKICSDISKTTKMKFFSHVSVKPPVAQRLGRKVAKSGTSSGSGGNRSAARSDDDLVGR